MVVVVVVVVDAFVVFCDKFVFFMTKLSDLLAASMKLLYVEPG